MKRLILALLLLAALTSACAQPPPEKGGVTETEPRFSAEGRVVRVYTTAKDTDQRMPLTGELELAPGEQPPETDISVFVNPEKRFQTLLGIGGALTDASAEVFAKLSETRQEELLRAYFDPVEGSTSSPRPRAVSATAGLRSSSRRKWPKR